MAKYGVVAATKARAEALIADLELESAVAFSTRSPHGGRGFILAALFVDESALPYWGRVAANYLPCLAYSGGPVYRIGGVWREW